MSWKKVGSEGHDTESGFMKWTTIGQVVEGEWLGTKDGKYGDLGIIDTVNGGEVVFPMHTVLAKNLDEVSEGDKVKIVYKGKTSGKSGRTYHDFDVFIDEA